MRRNGSFLYPRTRPALSSAKGVWGLRDAYEGLQNAEWPVPSANYGISNQVSVYGGTSLVTSINSGTFPVSAGNSIAVFVSWYTTATVTLADTMGNTYTACTAVSATGPTKGQWFYCMNLGASSSSNVITVTFSVSSDYTTAQFFLLSGGFLKQFDTTASGTASASSVTSGSFNTAAAGIVLVGRNSYNAQSTTTWSSPYTPVSAIPAGGLYSSSAQNIFSSAQTGITVTETGNSSTNRALAVLALK